MAGMARAMGATLTWAQKLLGKNLNCDQFVVSWHNTTVRHCDRTRTLACHTGA